jgi:MFS family permease
VLFPEKRAQGERYNVHSEALIGAFFLPAGLGNISAPHTPIHSTNPANKTHANLYIVGAPIAGRLSDRILVKWRARRKGVWVPEDRLRASLFGAGVLVPGSILLFGLVTTFIGGPIGIALDLILLFINGLGVSSHVK